MFALVFPIVAILAITATNYGMLSRTAALPTLVVALALADVPFSKDSPVLLIVRMGICYFCVVADYFCPSQLMSSFESCFLSLLDLSAISFEQSSRSFLL
jgi:hypothetical protein